MTDVCYVGIADGKMLSVSGVLACSALGSCVCVCLWDRQTRLTGMLHALLPCARDAVQTGNPFKFADAGTEALVRAMEAHGASRERLCAKLAGGACLYRYERSCAASEIGARNVAAARAALHALCIPILAEHVGGGSGRSVRLNCEDFSLRVHVLSQGVATI